MSSSSGRTALLSVRVTPGAGRDVLLGWQGDLLRLSVAAPAELGRANEAALRLLATSLGLPPRQLRIVRGHTSRQKVIAIEGLNEAEVRARLAAAG